MFRRNLWKITLSVLLVVWAVSTLYPLKDQPFADYARSHAGAKSAEFNKLLDEATARVKAGTATSEFVALRQIGHERKLDLTQYFPSIKLEDKLKNVEKRNNILLTELLARSKSKLQLGLDLRGGVAVTLEVDPAALAKLSEYDRKEKLAKAVDIISARINSFGVAEPIIRPQHQGQPGYHSEHG
jgi:SecD/SecF fusion protein